jgi:hypothetical protein
MSKSERSSSAGVVAEAYIRAIKEIDQKWMRAVEKAKSALATELLNVVADSSCDFMVQKKDILDALRAKLTELGIKVEGET